MDEHLSEELGSYFGSNGVSSMLGVGIFVRKGAMGKATSVFLEETFQKPNLRFHVLPQLPHEIGRTVPTL
jgi:hypothetical protein